MIRKRNLSILFGLFLTLGLCRVAPAQTEPLSFFVQTNASSEVHARDKSPRSKNDPTEVLDEIRGDEQSECDLGADVSIGKAHAKVVRDFEAPTAIGYALTADAFAKGGSRITCGDCVRFLGKTQCVFREPEYYRSSAFSRASLAVDLRFAGDARPLPYNVTLNSTTLASAGSTAELQVRLEDPSGSVLVSGWNPGSPVRIAGEPGTSYRMLIQLIARAAGDGGGSEHRRSTVKLDLKVERAPIMESADDPIIQGGETTSAFPEVGALLWDGQGLCSGTLIGPRTVLTAAHCVYGFGDISRMSFVTGHTYDNPDPKDLFPVTAVYYHKDYEDQGLKNDIAVVAVGRSFNQFCALPDEDARLSGLPTLDNFVQTREELTFLGFGRRNVDGQQLGAGTKRKVGMRITQTDGNKFYYYNPGKSTCQGDSGGPVLKTFNGKQYVLGVASAGNCKDEGWQMRVESYVPWLREMMQRIEGGHISGGNPQSGTQPDPLNPCPPAATP